MIDMHLHSNFSDGILNCEALANKLYENNVTHAVLTDHDCILGTNSFQKECQKYNITTISGCELEAYYDLDNSKYLHVLCYSYKDEIGLNNYLEKLRTDRIKAIKQGINNLKSQGIDINLEQVMDMSCGRHLLINHLCMLLERNKIVKSKYDAYNMFLNPTSNFQLDYPKPTVEETIEKIYEFGGIPVLAHPKRIEIDYTQKEVFLRQLIENGLKGIESYYSFDNKEERAFSEYIANKYDLIETVGSDWHYPEEGINFGNQFISQKKLKKIKKEFFNE